MNETLLIDDLVTPCLLLDGAQLERNIHRMSTRIGSLGGVIRPHVKTQKSIDVTKRVLKAGNTRGITVSTLREAEYFFDNGISDILYAVGVAPNKLNDIARLMTSGCDLKIILDDPEVARHVARDGAKRGLVYKVLIELDTDGHRSGVDPAGDTLIAIGRELAGSPGADLLGVLTHAGESYFCRSRRDLEAMARQERDRTIQAAERLGKAGMPCTVVSIGSTPTALTVDDLTGITEVRAGVYVFFDLVMAGLGVCDVQDIGISVLTSIIGYQRQKNWVITDAGWMAMSRDRGTANQAEDFGYGLIVDIDGRRFDDLIVSTANQEHGVVSTRDSAGQMPWTELPLGGLLRVLPNHACATASEFDCYHVLEGRKVIDTWPRIRGW